MKSIRFAIAQMNPTVGDYGENTAKILDWINKAESEHADIIVFPELALCGYPIWDLANKNQFVLEGLKHLNQIAAATRNKKIAVVIGFVDRSEKKNKSRARSHNALAWIHNGRVKAKHYKRLLPTYDVFLEDIFFEPGKESRPITWNGMKVGPMICEDIWDDDYQEKPLKDLKKKQIDFAINISASPFFQGVSEKRDQLLSRQARSHRCPVLYVNQVGAQDDLIFDGRSLFVDTSGKIIFRTPAFREDLFFFNWQGANPKTKEKVSRQKFEPEAEVYEALVLGVRDYCRKNRFHKVALGLSGGIDSSLVACIAADALGPSAVCGITMPSEFSSEGSWKDSESLAKKLGIEFRTYPIREKYQALVKMYQSQRPKVSPEAGKITLAMENLQARLRGLELMYISNDEHRLLLTTGNKSELAVGYCTLYGDMAGGLCVIGDVYKTDVYRLSQYRNQIKAVIPQIVFDKPPSAELRPNQTDQDSLPPYEVLDEILYLHIEKNLGADEISNKLKKKGIQGSVIREVIRKVDHNEYKRRQTPPVLRVTEKSWFGRRMPITNRFEN